MNDGSGVAATVLEKMHSSIVTAIALLGLIFSTGPSSGETMCSDEGICVETVGADQPISLFVLNKMPAVPVSVSLELTLRNMSITDGSTETVVVNGGERVFVARIANLDPGRWSWKFKYHWNLGDYKAEHNDDHVYRLPFRDGETYTVGQGCNGRFTHKGELSQAIDFDMPEGTPVLAARSGKVVDVVEHFTEGGKSSSFRGQENKVVILHKDRTLGIYLHLRVDGAAVEIGDYVEASDIIGYSGNTGYSSDPHLHFSVTKGTEGKSSESLPFTLGTKSGLVTCPEQGTELTAG